MPTIEYVHHRIDADGTEHLAGSTAEVSEQEAENAESYGYGFRVPDESRDGLQSASQPEPPESALVDEEPVGRTVDATSAAEELAEEHGLDLAEIEGSGKGGRILKGDVEAEVVEAES